MYTYTMCRFSVVSLPPVTRTARILVDARKLDQSVFRQRDLVHARSTDLQLVRAGCTTSLDESVLSIPLDFLISSFTIFRLNKVGFLYNFYSFCSIFGIDSDERWLTNGLLEPLEYS